MTPGVCVGQYQAPLQEGRPLCEAVGYLQTPTRAAALGIPGLEQKGERYGLDINRVQLRSGQCDIAVGKAGHNIGAPV